MGLMMLTIRTMAIPAGTIDQVILTAFFARIDCRAKMLRPAIYDGINDFPMLKRHGITVALNILRAIVLEDVFNRRRHGQILSSYC